MKKYIFVGTIIISLFFILPTLARNEDSGPKGLNETSIAYQQLKNLNTTNTNLSENNNDSDPLQRRSRVANAVQEMLNVADREGNGIGEQVKEIAREQNRIHEEIENNLEKLQNRNRFVKFFFGPKYDIADTVEGRVEQHNEKMLQLQNLVGDLVDENLKTQLEEQIQTMEEVKVQIEEKLVEETSGFSLFGWVKKLFR